MSSSVVVTGAASGIGRATAERLADGGWHVVGLDLTTDVNTGFELIAGDVTDHGSLARAAATAGALAPLRGWVNNVGINRRAPLHLLDSRSIRHIVETNLVATVVGCQVALQAFIANGGGGAIVNVSSIHALAGFPDSAVYDATKAAIEALTRAVCVEYGHLGIRCNSVAPGAVDTAANRQILAVADEPASLRRQWEALAVDDRMLSPDEIAEPIAFLLSPAASGINGQRLGIDSGASARCFVSRSAVGTEES